MESSFDKKTAVDSSSRKQSCMKPDEPENQVEKPEYCHPLFQVTIPHSPQPSNSLL